jgi:hypothetical protein
MFQWLHNWLRIRGGPLKKPEQVPEQEERLLSKSLDDNKQVLAEIFDRCGDLAARQIRIGKQGKTRALLVYFSSLVSLELLEEGAIKPLQGSQPPASGITMDWLMEEAILNAKVSMSKCWVDIAGEITKGSTALIMDGQDQAPPRRRLCTGRP